MRNRPIPLVALALCAGLLAISPSPGHAQESGGLGQVFKDALDELLRGSREREPPLPRQAPAPVPEQPQAEAPAQPAPRETRVPGSREEVQLSFAPVVKRSAPSVVNVYAKRARQAARSPFAGDPFFEQFFGRRPERGQSSLGSGVIITSEGVILTNAHVIEGMDEVKVALSDGREFECDILLKDTRSDLAVLKARDAGPLTPLEMGDSDAVEVGDMVLAIGNPFGVGQTVTMGIVSAVSRSLQGVNDHGYFIQTDAAINPGNSGGALVDMQGRLIGINTMIYSRSGGSIGLGYAIPSNMTRIVLQSAQSGDRVSRPWLGASVQNVTADIADSLGLPAPRGAMVTTVTQDSPADKAGLKAGDVILAVDGSSIEQPDALGYRLDIAGADSTVTMEVLTRGERRDVKVALASPPEVPAREQRVMPRSSSLAGATAANLSPAVAQEIGFQGDGQGVVLVKVEPRSPAASNGLQVGDIVREVNGSPISKPADLETATNRRGRDWAFLVERAGQEIVFERSGPYVRRSVR